MKKSDTPSSVLSESDDMLTPKEAAKVLMISPVTLRQWAQKGLIPAYQTVGGHRRFKKSEILKLLEQNQRNSHQVTKILIIDDDEGILKMLSTTLKEQYSDKILVETSSNGFDGGLKVVTFNPEILILDLMMKEMNGFDVCQQVKQNSKTSNIRIITMTGYPSAANSEKIISLGAEECLAKPLDLEKLFQHLAIK